ncbi:MAG TPA: lipid A deacylase LpxR family protein [Longimicrobium sp.]|jgi:hypothetical protein
MPRLRWLLALLLGLLASRLEAQTRPYLSRTFHWENDLQLSDKSYTNGLRYSWLLDAGPAWEHRARHNWFWRPLLLGMQPCPSNPEDDASGCYRIRTGIAYGQNFYTPENLASTRYIAEDRPYAGFIYLGRVFEASRGKFVHEIEYDLGLVGPLALGESVQKGWHQIVGAVHPEGWDHQIPNSPAVQARYRIHYRLLEVGGRRGEEGIPLTRNFDAVPLVETVLGTPITHGAVGATVRLGLNVPAGFSSRIAPTLLKARTASAIRSGGSPTADEEREWERLALQIRQEADRPRDHPPPYYLFVSGRAVGVVHNAFLEGTLLRDSPHSPPMERSYLEYEGGAVVRLPWIGRAQSGAPRLTLRGPDIAVRFVARGPEFEGADWHHFWAASLTF